MKAKPKGNKSCFNFASHIPPPMIEFNAPHYALVYFVRRGLLSHQTTSPAWCLTLNLTPMRSGLPKLQAISYLQVIRYSYRCQSFASIQCIIIHSAMCYHILLPKEERECRHGVASSSKGFSTLDSETYNICDSLFIFDANWNLCVSVCTYASCFYEVKKGKKWNELSANAHFITQ